MSAIKTATSALTAVALVTGISFAWAQTEDQQQPADPVAASTAQPLSEQTPADPNAAMPAETAAAEQMPAEDPAKVTPPVENTTTTTDTTTTTTTSPSYDSTAPAPRADRH